MSTTGSLCRPAAAPRFASRVALLLALLLLGCGEPAATVPAAAPAIASAGKVAVRVVLPASAGAGLQRAGEDLVDALAATTGATASPLILGAVPSTGAVVAVEISGTVEARGLEGFRIDKHAFASGAIGLRVRAATELGASHGLRAVCEALGVRWYHPEETFVPPADAARALPWDFDGALQAPRFAFRGLHEHTQHPIPASDFVFRPAEPGFAEMARNWLLWIARNRNNVASFHMLKSVDLDTWLPELSKLAVYGREHGVRLGMVTSFADQQQNNYKHIDESKTDAGGAPVADEVQIRASLDRLVGAGIDWIAFQIGTSEFTKPDDARVLGWLQTALDHLATAHPGTETFAWIHTTCSLKDEKGGYFYHLPLQSPAALGAWVHTTMFYTLEHPAPVYDCETFHQQRDFATAAAGTRPLVYFPETAWWLGFDNNVPLALPITGWSRHYDAAALPDAYSGHVTFTSGREWGYWMYDHHVLRLGWDAQTSWRDYLDDVAGLFGAHGAKVADVLERWAERQVQDIYVTNPMLTFYLAGELPQDEIGAAAGILARRPKPAFGAVLAYDAAAWKGFESDLADLAAMQKAYGDLLAELPAPDASAAPADLAARLYAELHATLWLYVRRIEHTRRLYQGVVALRPWQQAKLAAGPTGDPDVTIRDVAKAAAAVELSAAVTIGDAVASALVAGEARYRYPVEILARPKPETKTSYPFGYLEQTSTAFFWRRREAQLAALVDKATGGGTQAWSVQPTVVATTGKEQTSLVAPDHPVAKSALPGFVPRLLWGATAAAGGGITLAIATDFDANGLPDAGSEQDVALTAAGAAWTGTLSPFSLEVQDSAGNPIGTLHLLDAAFSATLQTSAGVPSAIDAVTVSGGTPTDAFIALMQAVGGIDVAGASALLKSVFGVAQTEPLPPQLPVAFAFAPVAP